MVKDHTRDYATAAFRFWAQVGGIDSFRLRILEDVEARNAARIGKEGICDISSPVEAWMIKQDEAYKRYAAEVADLEAVAEVLRISEYMHNGKMMRQALEFVYFTDAKKPLEKGAIEMRVHRAELMMPASYRTVYRLLRKAREIFAENRGLRTS